MVRVKSAKVMLLETQVLYSILHQGRIEPPKAARGHATHIDGIVLNVTKFRIQIICSLHCASYL